jgi:hypothetical protein
VAINGYPVSNQSTLNEFSQFALESVGNELFDLLSDAHLDPSPLNKVGYPDLWNNQPTQYQTFSSEIEAENPRISQDCSDVDTALILPPEVNSHVLSSYEGSTPVSMTIDSIQGIDDEALLSQKLPTPNAPDGSNVPRRSGPASTPRGFVFVSGLADPWKAPELPNKGSGNDAKALKASGGACWRCKFVRKKVVLPRNSVGIVN